MTYQRLAGSETDGCPYTVAATDPGILQGDPETRHAALRLGGQFAPREIHFLTAAQQLRPVCQGQRALCSLLRKLVMAFSR